MEAVFLIWKEVYLEAGMVLLLMKDGGCEMREQID
jgi:hypothetical protein